MGGGTQLVECMTCQRCRLEIQGEDERRCPYCNEGWGLALIENIPEDCIVVWDWEEL